MAEKTIKIKMKIQFDDGGSAIGSDERPLTRTIYIASKREYSTQDNQLIMKKLI